MWYGGPRNHSVFSQFSCDSVEKRGFFQSPGNSRFDKINKLDLKVIGSIGRFHVTYLF